MACSCSFSFCALATRRSRSAGRIHSPLSSSEAGSTLYSPVSERWFPSSSSSSSFSSQPSVLLSSSVSLSLSLSFLLSPTVDSSHPVSPAVDIFHLCLVNPYLGRSITLEPFPSHFLSSFSWLPLHLLNLILGEMQMHLHLH